MLLFTDNPEVADCVGQEVIKIEQSLMLFELSFPQSIGVSLVDGVPQVLNSFLILTLYLLRVFFEVHTVINQENLICCAIYRK